MRRRILAVALVGSVMFIGPHFSSAQEPKAIKLPEPQTEGGKPLVQALKARQTSREFGAEAKLPMQVLSNLLWAANGVNRPDGKRTAPTAVNWQNLDVYVATAEGLYLYDAPKHALKVLLTEDVRAATGQQDFVKAVPLDLVYVADYAKTKTVKGISNENTDVWSAAEAGFVSQNVYLFCASEGLATVVRGMFDRDALGKVLKLRLDQKIILTQSVGYPKSFSWSASNPLSTPIRGGDRWRAPEMWWQRGGTDWATGLDTTPTRQGSDPGRGLGSSTAWSLHRGTHIHPPRRASS